MRDSLPERGEGALQGAFANCNVPAQLGRGGATLLVAAHAAVPAAAAAAFLAAAAAFLPAAAGLPAAAAAAGLTAAALAASLFPIATGHL
jgi:hypothetical protein